MCTWPGDDKIMIAYHDTEWGVPLHDDVKFFEFLVLDAAQAGLSWRTVLHRREGYRKAFANFDVHTVAAFADDDFDRLMQDLGIIRNRLKIKSAILGAKAFIEVQKEFGSFDAYIWQFVGGSPIINQQTPDTPYIVSSPESDAMSKDLKKRGFTFVGTTICYAFMQAAGLVNDHLVTCPRYLEVQALGHQPTSLNRE